MRLKRPTFCGLAALFLMGGSLAAAACSVPVFRYALERWPPDDYEAVIFHRGPLPSGLSALVESLDPDRSTYPVLPNLRVRAVDLDAQPEESLLALWKSLQVQTLPSIAVLYPRSAEIPGPAWSGALNEQTLAALVDSPLRRDIARRILGGDSAVWVLLESGDKEKDGRAAEFLARRLEHLEKDLRLPTLEDEDASLVSDPDAELKLKFSLVRLARTDPAEAVLVRMLLGSESDLNDMPEPIVFPVFGRGRALFALVGKGINEENVDEAGMFLVGPCSCQVKELNPGVDLLLAVNWEESIESQMLVERELPPLSGFAGMGAEPARSGVMPEAQAGGEGLGSGATGGSTNNPAAGATSASPMLPRLTLVALVGLALVGGFTLAILLRK